MMPPRRTRAMGFSPGGAKALDISAPSRKRKNQSKPEVTEPIEDNEDHPTKRSKVKTASPEPSIDDSKQSRAAPKKSRTNQTRRTRRTGGEASSSNNNDTVANLPDTAKSPPTAKRPARQTRGQANNKSTVDNQETQDVPSLASTEVPSKKRTRAQLSLESPSEDDSQPQQASTSVEVQSRPSKRTRVHSHTRPLQTSTAPKAEHQGKITQKTNQPSYENFTSAQQPSPPGSESPTIDAAAAHIASESEQDMSDARSEGSQEAPDATGFELDAASDASEATSEVHHDTAEYGDEDSEGDIDAASEDNEYHRHDLEIAPPSTSNSRFYPENSATSKSRRPANTAESRASPSASVTKTKPHTASPVQLTDDDIADIDQVRNRSSAWKFAQSTYQRKFAVDDEMEDEDWERLAAQQFTPKYPLKSFQEDIDKARHTGSVADRDREQKKRTSKPSSARYIEWVDDSDAMFVVRSNDQLTAPSKSVGSNREKTFYSIPTLLIPNVKRVPLTNKQIIDAVSTTIQLCMDNPENIPTRAELSSLFKDVAQSRQHQPVAPSTPPSRARSRFARSQTTATPLPVTPAPQSHYNSIPASSSTANQTMSPSNESDTAERQEQSQVAVQPEAGRGGWAAALSASRIGTLLQTPLRLFSRGNRAQQNAPATDVRRIAPPTTQENITRSERPRRNARPVTFSDRKASSSSREHETERAVSTDLPKTPTPAPPQIPKGRRRDAHLPVEWRGVRYQDLPPDLQAISQHMKPAETPGSKTLSAEEQKFLDDNYEIVRKQREINMKRILSGRTGIDAFREEEDFTQVTQDLSHDQPGSKRKRVTFAQNNSAKKPHSGTFAVPDDSDSDEDSLIIPESPPSSRRLKKPSPRLPIPGSFSPIDRQDGSPPAKKARVESKETPSMGPHLWLNLTAKDVYGPTFGEPLIPSVDWRRSDPEPEPPLLQRPAQRDDNVFGNQPKALNEISANRAPKPKPVIHDSFQKSQKHMPKNPSTLRHVTTMSPTASPGAPVPGQDSMASTGLTPTAPAKKSDYGPYVTDPAVIAYVNGIPEERIVLEKFPLRVYKELTGMDHPSLSE